MKQALYLFTCLAITALGVPSARAQIVVNVGPEPAAADSAFEHRITEAWREVQDYWQQRDAGEQGLRDPQPAYAREFFRYYLEHTDSPTGQRALTSAFTMWGDTGEIGEVEQAVSQLAVDSDQWSPILTGIGSAFEKQDRTAEYVELLYRLDGKLTHPKSHSGVLLRLAEHFADVEQPDSAKPRLEQILALDAQPIHVRRARNMLYEIATLGIGGPAPAFTAQDLEGAELALADLRGKVVVLDFWATWCGPCLPEIPHLKELAARHREDDFLLLGISLDTDPAALKTFLAENGITWPQVYQEAIWDGEVAQLYNVSAIPRSFVIDRQGRIAHKDLRGEQLAEAVAALLEQR